MSDKVRVFYCNHKMSYGPDLVTALSSKLVYPITYLISPLRCQSGTPVIEHGQCCFLISVPFLSLRYN